MGYNRKITFKIASSIEEKIIKREDQRIMALLTVTAERLKDEGRNEGRKEGIKKGIEKGRKEGIEKGIEKGRKEGIEKGRKEGIEKGRMETAAQMLKDGLGIDKVKKYTGLADRVLESLMAGFRR